jgi:hypothetical protein
VLKLDVPLGTNEANTEVVVTIQSTSFKNDSVQQKPWQEFLDDTYGSCAGLGLERAPQGEYETRESLD